MSDGGASAFSHVIPTQRALLEKSLQMRCLAYLADAKAALLAKTVSVVGEGKRETLSAHQKLQLAHTQLREEIERRQDAEKTLRIVNDCVDELSIMMAIFDSGAITYSNRQFQNRFPQIQQLSDLLRCADGTELQSHVESGKEKSRILSSVRFRDELWAMEARVHVHRSNNSIALVIDDVTREREVARQYERTQRFESLGEMTGGIAHDFNNQLAVVSANIELLSDAPNLSDQQRELIQQIATVTQGGARLTQKLLAYAKRQPLSTEAVDLKQAMPPIEGVLRRSLGEQYVLKTAYPGEGCVASCDVGLLESAVANLVLNARDASDPGSTIWIRVENVELQASLSAATGVLPAGHYVRLAVHDPGSGIPDEILNRMWEPFFSTKAPDEGSGLGLSMVAGFAAQCGGAIDVSSSEFGTTFRLYLPSADRDQAEQPAAAGTQAVGQILFVEDDTLVRTSISNIIESLGYTVCALDSQADAVAALASGDVALLITDVTLRGQDSGIEVARAARSFSPTVPIIFLSGYAPAGQLGAVIRELGAEFLRKPVPRARVAEAIRRALGPDAAGA